MADYLSAAVQVLRAAGRPLTTREVTEEALGAGLLDRWGKTPEQTMGARLYVALRDEPDCPVRRLCEPGPARARRGSVRWALRE